MVASGKQGTECSRTQNPFGKKGKKEQSAPDTKGERFIKPKAELSVGIPESSTPGLKTAVAAKPRAKRRILRLNKSTIGHFTQVIHALTQETNLSQIKDDGSLPEDEVDYGTAGSGHDNDVESNGPDNDAQPQDADSADSADTAVSGGPRRWKRDEHKWETASAPSHWCPNPSASRARSVDRSPRRFGASLLSRTAVAAQLSGVNVHREEVFTDLRKRHQTQRICPLATSQITA